jgi:hypothetical protein
VLAFLGKKKAEARKRYRNFVAKAKAFPRGRNRSSQAAVYFAALEDGRLLSFFAGAEIGSRAKSGYWETAISSAVSCGKPTSTWKKGYRLKSEGVTFADVADRVVQVMDLPPEII